MAQLVEIGMMSPVDNCRRLLGRGSCGGGIVEQHGMSDRRILRPFLKVSAGVHGPSNFFFVIDVRVIKWF